MHEVIERAKSDFLQAKQQLISALETTPDDRVNWSPSPTARTPVQIVAHSALAIKQINQFLDGRPLDLGNTAEADRGFREWEQQFGSREETLDLLNRNSADYERWLDNLSPDRLETMVELPFGLGQAPVGVGLTFPPMHTNFHVAQIQYIQTIYGDRDWHS